MTIKTTRIKSTQAPIMETLDLSNQLNGSRQTFSLPRKIHNFDRNYLVWNSTVYRNDVNHRYYSVSADGMSITTYFDTAPAGGPGHTLQLAVDMSGDGADQTASKADVEEAVTKLEAADAGIKEDLEAEATTRQERDGELQSQIDAVVNSSDVKDVVGTKAELDAYDKSTLGDNDIIKVLKDESEEDATTYYRYVKAENDFKVIGEIGPYYTKAEANEKFISGDGNSNYVFLEKPWKDTIMDSDSVKNGLPTPWWTDSTYSIFMANQPQRLANVHLGTSIILFAGAPFQDFWNGNIPSEKQDILASVVLTSGVQAFPQSGSLSHAIVIGPNALERIGGSTWNHSVIITADEDPMFEGDQDYNVAIMGQTHSSYNIAIGAQSQAGDYYKEWNDPGCIAIGSGAQVHKRSIALGDNAWDSSHHSVVLLGHGAQATRDEEVSVGGGKFHGEKYAESRYISNVKAGELDTDAVNLKQMKDYVDEHAGGGEEVPTRAKNLPQFVIGDSNPTLFSFPYNGKVLQFRYPRIDLNGSTSGTSYLSDPVPTATPEKNGIMSAEDKVKLDAIKLPAKTLVASGYVDLTTSTGDLVLKDIIPASTKFTDIHLRFDASNSAAKQPAYIGFYTGDTLASQNIQLNTPAAMPGLEPVYCYEADLYLNKQASERGGDMTCIQCKELETSTEIGDYTPVQHLSGVLVNDAVTGIHLPFTLGSVYYEVYAMGGE